MARFTGFMCDVCSTAATGEVRPVDWISLKLSGNGSDASKDICGDKCLLKLARERVATDKPTRGSKKASAELLDFLSKNGVQGQKRGTVIGNHVRRRHEMNGYVGDCLVCEFNEIKEGISD